MLKWLNRACNERNMKVFILNQDPRFDACRGSSRIQKSRGTYGPHGVRPLTIFLLQPM